MKKIILYIGLVLVGAIILFHIIIFQQPKHSPPTLTELIFNNDSIKKIVVQKLDSTYNISFNNTVYYKNVSIDSMKILIRNFH